MVKDCSRASAVVHSGLWCSPPASSPSAADTGTRLDGAVVGLRSLIALPGAPANPTTPVQQYLHRVLAAVIQLWLVPGSDVGLAEIGSCIPSAAAVRQQ